MTIVEIIKAYKGSIDWMTEMADNYIDIFDSPLSSTADVIFDTWLNDHFTEEGVELVYWWIFEDVDKLLYDDKDNSINVEDIEEFVKYLQENNYVKSI